MSALHADPDISTVTEHLQRTPDIDSVASFRPSEHLIRLALRFDIGELRSAAEDLLGSLHDQGDGFSSFLVTRRPGVEAVTETDRSGRYYLRVDDSGAEVAREDIVDEAAYCELHPELRGTYFEEVHAELSSRFVLGRMRLLMKDRFNCNSWHRDPEPRLHVPIRADPGSLFIVNHHCTHLPADGSVYFADTRGYHTALNGGDARRLHLVAAVVGVR